MGLLVLIVGLFFYLEDSPSELLLTFSAETIADIQTKSSEFHNQSVTVQGVVGKRLGFLGSGMYYLDDGTDSILIMTSKALPATGSKVIVQGVVNQTFSFGDNQVVVIVEATNSDDVGEI